MFPSPLNLLFYGIENFSFSENRKGRGKINVKAGPETIDTEVELMVSADGEQLYKARLKISASSKERSHPPYKISMSMIGVFSVEESFPKEQVEFLVGITGVSLLYSAAREYIFSSTAHGKFGPYMLPTISFRPDMLKAEPQDALPPPAGQKGE